MIGRFGFKQGYLNRPNAHTEHLHMSNPQKIEIMDIHLYPLLQT
jgi:hypothetical protein